MARYLPSVVVLAVLALAVSAALAVTPSEYLYGTSQTSSLTITNPGNSTDGSFNDSVASISGWAVDSLPNQWNNWTFTAIQDTNQASLAGVVAEIRFGQSGWVNDSFAFEVHDGIGWSRVVTFTATNPPPSALTTLSYDVTSVLNTVVKVNAAQLRLVGVARSGGKDSMTLSVDGVRLGVEAPPIPTSTPTPTSSAVSTPTSAATPTSTPAASETPTSTPTSTPVASATPTWTPTEVPPSGTTDIMPNYSQDAFPGFTVPYTHTVTQLGKSFDTKDITVTSSQGWAIALYRSDGTTPLSDTNGNGTPDTGQLTSGQFAVIVVKVTVPGNANASVQDVTTVSANSGRNPGPANTDSATDTTTVRGVLTMNVPLSSVSFGVVSPNGEVDPTVPGVSSSIDEFGAYYVKAGIAGQGSLTVTVSSNAPWTGVCWAEENNGSGAGMLVGDGKFEWSLAGMGSWTPFTTQPQSPPYDNSCFASRSVSANTYGYDFRLRVDWTDSPGTFNSNVIYIASQ